MRKIHLRQTALSLFLLVSLVSLAACGNSNKTNETSAGAASPSASAAASSQSSSEAPSPSESAAAADPAADLSKVTLRVGQTGWGTYEQGLKAAGLNDTPYKIEYSVFQGGNLQLEAIAADHLDLALTSEIPPIFASLAAGGGNFKIIALSNSNTLNQEVVIPKDSKIKTVADLKGKKVAYVKATTAQYFLVKILEQAGLTWNDIEPVELSTADGLSALLSGKVEALASYGNAITSAHDKGATTLASAKDILSGNFPIEATPAAIADPGKHAAIVDYLSRLNKYSEWTRNHQEEWSKIVAAATKQDVGQALQTLKDGEAQRPTKIVPISPAAIASNQDVADTLHGLGLLENKIDVSALYSDAFSAEIK
ncbi:ABC transporter substrate-binding protein [Cohnella sp. AR92]|uniref:ABC transporter substrate-binding protein n=1 Tax=Cohnella sp. AR92 TaxID=648716 RepID=UPI000F8D9A00|nr:ABC transporter substrate-binding protein [Cohnella sp. AR92]RUS42835.1 ABC transporter substrate-binding protein [Cohnella sp. AR92]